jgi:uncharacterized protein YdaU (DUF1376 family)
MAKDPAFLFYPGDWLGGTLGMTLEQKGCYLELLILQFNTGKFTEAQAKQVLSICFTVAWPMLKQKFKTDGIFFWNDRLQVEIERRKNFSKSRRDNALHPKNKKASAEHMHKHMETETETKTKDLLDTEIENFLVPEMQNIFKQYNKTYKQNRDRDYKPLLSIAKFLSEQGNLTGNIEENKGSILAAWDPICQVISKDKFYSTKTLSTISNQIQEITQIALHGKSNGKPDYGSKERANEYDRLFTERYGKG